jgi:hypothetical protein
MARCRSCGAEVIWAVTASGKRMPVDADPVPEGNVLLADDGDGTVHASVMPEAQALLTEEPMRLSHFVTCPQADEHRRPR